jgi:hypothetical protein
MKLSPLSLLLCAVAAASPVAIGCSSSGSEDAPEPQADTGAPVVDASPVVDSGSPADLDAAGDAASDAGTVQDATIGDATVPDAAADAMSDATVRDAGADAAPVDAGTVCRTGNDFEERSCGVCGRQSRICRAQADGGLGWADWSFCNGQLDGGCVPGTEPDGGLACGNRCGRQRAVCQNDCAYAYGACIAPPGAVCDKGTSAWTQDDAGCTDPTHGRRRSCLNDCSWGTWSDCEPFYTLVDGGLTTPAELTITNDQAKTVTKTLVSTTTMARLPTFPSACPLTGTFSSTATSYVYATVGNATSQPRTVAVWASTPTGGTSIDTVTAVYANATGPTDEASRRSCVGTVNDTCASGNPQGCASPWSGLVGTEAIVIPAGATYTVLVQAYFSGDVGGVVINAKAVN